MEQLLVKYKDKISPALDKEYTEGDNLNISLQGKLDDLDKLNKNFTQTMKLSADLISNSQQMFLVKNRPFFDSDPLKKKIKRLAEINETLDTVKAFDFSVLEKLINSDTILVKKEDQEKFIETFDKIIKLVKEADKNYDGSVKIQKNVEFLKEYQSEMCHDLFSLIDNHCDYLQSFGMLQ